MRGEKVEHIRVWTAVVESGVVRVPEDIADGARVFLVLPKLSDDVAVELIHRSRVEW